LGIALSGAATTYLVVVIVKGLVSRRLTTPIHQAARAGPRILVAHVAIRCFRESCSTRVCSSCRAGDHPPTGPGAVEVAWFHDSFDWWGT